MERLIEEGFKNDVSLSIPSSHSFYQHSSPHLFEIIGNYSIQWRRVERLGSIRFKWEKDLFYSWYVSTTIHLFVLAADKAVLSSHRFSFLPTSRVFILR